MVQNGVRWQVDREINEEAINSIIQERDDGDLGQQ